MKTGHLNRPKTDEIIYPIHKKIIAIENSKNVPIYFIFRAFSISGLPVSDSHQYSTKVTNSQAPFVGLMVVASNAPVYTRHSLLVADGPQAPRSCVRCTSRRWRLLVYTSRGGHPGGAAPGGRTAAVGSTTTSHRLMVSKNLYSQPRFTVRPGLFPPCRVKFSGNKRNDSCENLPCLTGKSLAHPARL